MKDFTSGSIPRQMFLFSLPIITGNLVQAIYMVIDAIWVGRLIGPTALAAVSTTMPVIFFSAALLIGAGVASTILTGQAYGAKNNDLLKRVMANSFMIMVSLGLILTIVGVALAEPILRLINTPAAIFQDASLFLRITIAGFVSTTITQWFGGLSTGLGDARRPLVIQLSTIGLNVVLAPILISGWGTGHPLGIAGSAIATVIAGLAGNVIVLFLFRRNRFLRELGFVLKADFALIRRLLFMGIPMSLQMIVVSGSFLVITSLVNRFGESLTAAFGVGSRVDQFAFMTIMSVSMAISSMTAQNIGAGNFGRVRLIARWGVVVSLGFASVFLVAAFGFARPISLIFTSDPAVIVYTVGYLRIVCFAYLGFALLFAFQGVARGAGDMIASLVIVTCGMMIFRIPLCYLLAEHTPMRENGLWVGMTISIIAGGVLFWGYYLSGRWMRVKGNVHKPALAAEAPPT